MGVYHPPPRVYSLFTTIQIGSNMCRYIMHLSLCIPPYELTTFIFNLTCMQNTDPTPNEDRNGAEMSEQSTHLDSTTVENAQDIVLETPEAEDTDSDESTNTPVADFDVDGLRSELENARNVSIKKDQLRKEARAETRQLQGIITETVRNNPQHILKVHEQDPSLANTISKDLWGMDYQTMVKNNGQKVDIQLDEQPSRDDLRKELEALLSEKEQEKEYATIEKTENQFFKQLGLGLQDPKLKRIIKEYKQFNPQNVREAEVFLQHARSQVLGGSSSHTLGGDIDAVPSVGSGGSGSGFSGKRSKQLNPKLKAAAKAMGINQNDFQKFLSKRK